ncbi:DUF6712 family protein [Dyadobacter sp. SG02]|uniref:DUF6712 family protein n=1 Tax=Dyadobacter sp. SG02 TaxID=1855291 RepID=UPI00115FECF5|nr:DUF6712 family protein [Dyadobacter sp. SG02]
MLIASIEDFKKYVPVGRDLDITSIEPSIRKAGDRFILPMIGEVLYEAICDEYSKGTLDGAHKKLHDLICAAVAPLAVWNYAQAGGVQIDDSGIYKGKNEQRWNLGEGEQRKLEQVYFSDGMDAVDRMLNYLHKNLQDFPDYATSEEFLAERHSLVPSAATLETIHTLVYPRVTFRTMREALRYFENRRIKPVMQDYYENLLAKMDADLEPVDKTARDLAREALIYLATARALITQTVRITGEGIEVLVSKYMVSTAENSRIEAAAREFEKSGESALQALVSFLDKEQPTGYQAAVISPRSGKCPDKGGIAFF